MRFRIAIALALALTLSASARAADRSKVDRWVAATAAQSQKPILDLLAARGVEHRSYWIANMIWVRGDQSLVDELAARDDVFHIYANPSIRLRLPAEPSAPAPRAPETVEWNI